MPDLKSELSKVLNAWENEAPAEQPVALPVTQPTTPEPKMHHNVKSNVTHDTFNYVRDNPGLTRSEVISTLIAQGHKKGSITALVGVMVKQGHFSEVKGRLTANLDEYKPLLASKVFDKQQKAAARKAALAAKKATVVTHPSPATLTPLTTPSDWTVDSVIGSLNVRQAMAVYAELRGIFGA